MSLNVLEQRAIVSRVHDSYIVVTIEQKSACSGCHAASACSSADCKEREVTVYAPLGDFMVGEVVILKGQYAMGRLAVFLSFVVPLVITLIVALMANYLFHYSEISTALLTLASVGVYYGVLAMFRPALKRKFVFTIEKIHSNDNI
ncbi:SoxR reducing system RseC family protein [Porphyromonas circumdentaria]|uniref:Positive regulator of sigma(E), RseC/MucC n=1 Tax=Porphyromonas circumdentaria TaxID=29524 RepID=A0A1T4NNZ5_9PORP|nr:SoxR reducing system RseC family protein [Porphyromonas circumdentaria]MBB6276142.1 sigma-E factor negative regulatory protein RseC [Porphyromonas circumdentaria]MDO4721636.1 SoxR reducing system RseC family protein [Porphyromonas circumdentaria]SJZ80815.1 positive regulator of sigma(E), RseC/MucC [Porphyromonas circumdentaria]